ncbi:MAG: methylmalonyl Co-A mutase-associated GTPase MeaB [Actinomycetota bacterium]
MTSPAPSTAGTPGTATAPGAFERLEAGDPAALARALTVLETGGPEADALRRRLHALVGSATVVGFTGPPGVGKSTLVNAYVEALRRRERSVAVLAVDPSSPLSGGAVLGDRTRMGQHTPDPGVFVRSIASRGHVGGLALAVPAMLDAVDVAGFDDIVVEAVGAGQSEVEISRFADVTVVVNAPGLGDDVQAIKAGILEVADVLVVNKGDLPHADQTAEQLRSMLRLRSTECLPPVLTVSATERHGIDELVGAVDAAVGARGEPGAGPQRRATELLRQAALTEVERRLTGDALGELGAAVHRGEISLGAATEALLVRCAGIDIGRTDDDTEREPTGGS